MIKFDFGKHRTFKDWLFAYEKLEDKDGWGFSLTILGSSIFYSKATKQTKD